MPLAAPVITATFPSSFPINCSCFGFVTAMRESIIFANFFVIQPSRSRQLHRLEAWQGPLRAQHLARISAGVLLVLISDGAVDDCVLHALRWNSQTPATTW